MAISRDKFFESKQTASLWDVAVSLQRGNPLPIDSNSVFSDFGTANDTGVTTLMGYAKNSPIAYPGQTVAVVGTEETTLYILKAVGSGSTATLVPQEVGKATAGDDHSISLSEDGVLSLYGFEDATANYVPSVKVTTTTDGKEVRTLTWVPQTNSDVTTGIANLQEQVDNIDDVKIPELNTRIDNLGTVLNFKGVVNSDPNETPVASSYKLGDVIIFNKKEYVCAYRYISTEDTVIQAGKKYYSLTDGQYVEVTDPASTNPKADGYYEKENYWEPFGDPEGLTALQSTVDGHTTAITALQNADTEISGKVDKNTEDIAKIQPILDTKAPQSDLDALKETVTDHGTRIGKLETNYTNLNTVVDGHTTTIGEHAEKFSALETTTIPGLDGRISGNTTNISNLTELIGKGAKGDGEDNLITQISAIKTTADKAASDLTTVKSTAEAAMPKAGGTFTGQVKLDSAVVIEEDGDTQLVPKSYVDNKVAGVGIGNYYKKSEIDEKVTDLGTKISTAQSAAEAAQGAAEAAQATADANATHIGTIPTGAKSLQDQITAVKATAEAAAVKTEVNAAIEGINNQITTINSNIEAVETTANAAMPKAGGNFTGEVDVTINNVKVATVDDISTAKTELIGTGGKATTIQGLEKTVDTKFTAIDSSLEAIKGKTDSLSTVMNFVGASTTQPNTTTAVTGEDTEGINNVTINNRTYTPDLGDVVVYEGEEYVYDGTKWEKFGAATADTAAIAAMKEAIKANEDAIKSNDSDIEALQQADTTLDSAIKAVKATADAAAVKTEVDIAVSGLDTRVTKLETDVNNTTTGLAATYTLASAAATQTALSTEVTARENAVTTLTDQLTWGSF